MRWLAVWLFLTAAWISGWTIQAVLGPGWRFTRETAIHMMAVPLVQVAALWGVSRFRRMFRDTP